MTGRRAMAGLGQPEALGRGGAQGKALTGHGWLAGDGEVWRSLLEGWQPLAGSLGQYGMGMEWREFDGAEPVDWARWFHPGGVGVCFNLAGEGMIAVGGGGSRVEVGPQSLVFYHQGEPGLSATRLGGQRHQFLTVVFSAEFLGRHLGDRAGSLHPLVRGVVTGEVRSSQVALPERLGTVLLPVLESLRHPPVFAPAQGLWFQGKALELAANLFFRPPEGELFCARALRAAGERVERARAILRERLCEPPTLEELGRLVGCSTFYLSRLFSQQVGLTIQQYVRQVRMQRAAELLCSGRCNVTEAAMEVGYSSLSHFCSAFQETFGCCPRLYVRRNRQPEALRARARGRVREGGGAQAGRGRRGKRRSDLPRVGPEPSAAGGLRGAAAEAGGSAVHE